MNNKATYLSINVDNELSKKILLNVFAEEESEELISHFKIRSVYYDDDKKLFRKEEDLNTKPSLAIPNNDFSILTISQIENNEGQILTSNNRYYNKDEENKDIINPIFDPLEHFKDITTKPTIIVNDELDYLTLYLISKEIDINFISVYGNRLFLEKITALSPKTREKIQFILLHHLLAGNEAKREDLSDLLNKKHIFNYKVNNEFFFPYNSITEFYKHDKAKAIEGIKNILATFKETKDKEEAERIAKTREEYSNQHSINSNIGIYRELVNSNKLNEIVATTGFKLVDEALGGGITPNLHIIGAVSSLGKTTFILQIANHIAKTTDNDILFFSLEMNKYDLISKSIANESFLSVYEKEHNEAQAKDFSLSHNEVSQKIRQEYFNDHQKELLEESYKRYIEYSKKIFIYDRSDIVSPTINNIRRIIENHIKQTGKKPIIILDYLQIIRPEKNEIVSDPQHLNNVIDYFMELAHTDTKIPVILIQSYNRNSYYSESDISSGKGSGNIEYSADILLSLDYYDLIHNKLDQEKENKYKRDLKDLIRKAKKEDPRNVALKVLKNRGGKPEQEIDFNFYPKCDTFIEDEDLTKNLK